MVSMPLPSSFTAAQSDAVTAAMWEEYHDQNGKFLVDQKEFDACNRLGNAWDRFSDAWNRLFHALEQVSRCLVQIRRAKNHVKDFFQSFFGSGN